MVIIITIAVLLLFIAGCILFVFTILNFMESVKKDVSKIVDLLKNKTTENDKKYLPPK